jgi:hypothetical protein
VLAEIASELSDSGWYGESWIDEVLSGAYAAFEAACERWRTLYRSARSQVDIHTRIINDHARPAADRRRSRGLRAEAEAQVELLTGGEGRSDSDFYTYRYFASEGFLPGYNFPRLPLSAYIPGRRLGAAGRLDEFVSRPRFLAVSEFGPRALVYHDGSRYRIERVLMESNDAAAPDFSLPLGRAKICPACGYLHIVDASRDGELCEWCRTPLAQLNDRLFRMQNVSTRRIDRINSDEEERSRTGYEIRTAVRFSDRAGTLRCRTAVLRSEAGELARLSYGPAAVIWRINKGWKRRAEGRPDGFLLDIERGYWKRNEADEEDTDPNPLSPRVERVVPYVEDRRNCILLQPVLPEDAAADADLRKAWMASLESGFRSAVREEYQLEDAELASEPLPSQEERAVMLLFEAAEGGAGVLRQLLEDPAALGRVARRALEICHFDSQTGADLGRAEGSAERCEAACYDCLMSYANQFDHRILDRSLVRDWFLALRDAAVEVAPAAQSRGQHLQKLLEACGSELERRWLRFLEDHGYHLPSEAQRPIPECGTRPDFYYADNRMAVYVDGPIHEFPDRAQRDRQQEAALEAEGYWIVRFAQDADWTATCRRFPSVFGEGRP